MTCETTDAQGMDAWERAATGANAAMHALGRIEGLCRRLGRESTAAAGEAYRQRVLADLRDATNSAMKWTHHVNQAVREVEREEVRGRRCGCEELRREAQKLDERGRYGRGTAHFAIRIGE
jgi:hypothetical protein